MIRIRMMEKADVGAVVDLEKAIFSDAWSENSVQGTLDNRFAIAYVAEAQGEFAGYFLGTQLFEEAEVYRIAVHPSFRKQGIGHALMEAFMKESAKRGATEWSLEVRAKNAPAIALYESFGYRTESVRKNYYHNPEEDAAIMWCHAGNNSLFEKNEK